MSKVRELGSPTLYIAFIKLDFASFLLFLQLLLITLLCQYK